MKKNESIEEKKNANKQKKKAELKSTQEEIVVEEIKEVPKEEVIKEIKHQNKLLKVIKIIFLVITAPVWLPWKLLFVRRKDRKFKDMSTPIKVFRILRSPLTLPLKFAIFMLIISLELLIGYKIRFSPITYPITRASVHNYYLQKSDKKLLGYVDVSAAELSSHYDEFKTAFDYIDEWDIDSKNKMYVVLDANITKFVFKNIGDKSVSYLLNRFNNEESLREDLRIVVKNVNKTLNRAIKEIPDTISYAADFGVFLTPATSIGSMIDYRQALDIMWSGVSTMINTGLIEVNEFEEEYFEPEIYDLSIDAIVYYSKGHTLQETYDYLNKKYDGNFGDNTESSSTITNNVITAN